MGADRLTPFRSDGCTFWPDGPWAGCCEAHDRAYWQGGTRADRRAADIGLMVCVARRGYPLIAALMYLGVRIFGHPFWPTRFRWGHGHRYPRRYRRA